MQKLRRIVAVATVVLVCVSGTSADTFGTGVNQFTIDFVPISANTNPASGYGIVNNDYRIGKFEITNDQWNKFQAAYGVVTGNPSNAYNEEPYYTGTNVPTNKLSWYEAVQFVNWLNTSTGHQAAYKFTGTQGTGDYTFATWSVAEADGGINLYRHKDAFYYLPTEDEWVKAAYWNGTTRQTYATKNDTVPMPGVDTHYSVGPEHWGVGSGSEELNGTFDMMGNVWEWMESPYSDPNYGTSSYRVLRGGSSGDPVSDYLVSSYRIDYYPDYEHDLFGFRVASNVPEPSSLGLLLLGGLAMLRRRR